MGLDVEKTQSADTAGLMLPVTSLILFFLCCCVLLGLVITTHKTQFKNSFSSILLLRQCEHAVIFILLHTFGPCNHHSQNSVLKFYVKSVWYLEAKPCCEVFSLMSSPSGANTLRRLLPFFFFFSLSLFFSQCVILMPLMGTKVEWTN